ncbi:hypothetical protein MXB_3491, partial [Myxobolus squamalis]
RNKTLIFIHSNLEINDYISPNDLPTLFTSFFPAVKSTFIGAVFYIYTILELTETGIVLKYRNGCSFRKNNIERQGRNTIKFNLKDSNSFYFMSNQCDEILKLLSEFISPEILNNSIVSLDASVYDSLGTCLSVVYFYSIKPKALISIFYNEVELNRICLKYLKHLYKLIDQDPKQSNIFELDSSELTLKSATDLSENFAKSHKFLTFGVLNQTIIFLKKSNTSLQIYCLQIMSPWVLNIAESIEESNSQEKIKNFRLINHLINISLSYSNLIYDINLYIWSTISKCWMLAQFIMRFFLKVVHPLIFRLLDKETSSNVVVVDELSSNSTIEFIDRLSNMIIIVLTVNISHPSIQTHSLVLFAISDDISNNSLQKLILTIGKDLDELLMLFWIFEILAMGYLEKYDKCQTIKSLMKYNGINFAKSFHFSLAALIIKGLRANNCLIRNISISTLKLLLKMTSTRKSDNTLVEGILFQHSLIINEKLFSSLILNILQMANRNSQENSQNLNLISCKIYKNIISAKGFFGFISIISSFQKTTSLIAWEQFSMFCSGLVKEETHGSYSIE